MRTWAGKLRVWLILATFFAFRALAVTYFVDANGQNPTPPFTTWDTAATNIQDAVDASTPGDQIWVTNGVYDSGVSYKSGSNRVSITKSVLVHSVNGPSVTIIKGYPDLGQDLGTNAIRCVYLAPGATLSGFTLTNGTAFRSNGGGALCGGSLSVITNCVIAGNSARYAGGVYSGKLYNCQVVGNTIFLEGGGMENSVAVNCIISNNVAGTVGGGAQTSTLTNCLICGNAATNAGSGGGAYNCTLVNCTVGGNVASVGGGVSGGTVNNSIVFGNFSTSTGNSSSNYFGGPTFNNSCSAPLPAGANNISSSPQFMDEANMDFHLLLTSPCINAGNNVYAGNSTDLGDGPRTVGGVVDMGAFEYQYADTGPFYVNVSNTLSAFPYLSWDTAATNIQDAVDAAAAGATVLVSNGIYRAGGRASSTPTTNRVCVTRNMTIQSVNGAAVTSIEGYQIPGTTNGTSAIRCVYLTNGVILDGFTLTNGATQATGISANQEYGGGVFCESTNAFVRNCILTKCSAYRSVGAVYYGSLTNCLITNNVGGAYRSFLDHCVIIKNMPRGGFPGGGACLADLKKCLIISNSVNTANGGGVSGCTLDGCILADNTSPTPGYPGGGAYSSTLNNCLVFGNSANSQGGGAASCVLSNCTIVGNYSGSSGGGTYQCWLYHCINYSNTAAVQGSNYNNYYQNQIAVRTFSLPEGSGIMTNPPLFLSFSEGDFHLQSNSPCINAGNNSYVSSATDLDGNPRIVGGTVDIGAYEYQTPSSMLSYAWAQQYGLSTDGTADYADTDGDQMSNYAEWKSGTIPTNSASVLQLASPVFTNNPVGMKVTWQSVSGKIYYLQSSTNFAAQPAFTSIQSNIVGQVGTTSYTDTTATNATPYFYRVGVQ